MKLSHRIFVLILIAISSSMVTNLLLTQYQQRVLHDDSEKILVSTVIQSLRDALAEDVINGNKLRVTNLLRNLRDNDNPIDFLYISTGEPRRIFAHSFRQGFPRYLVKNINSHLHRTGITLTGRFQTPQGLIYEYCEPLIQGLDMVLHIGVNQSEIEASLAANKRYILFFSFLVAALVLIVAYYFSRQITSPLARFTEKIENFGTGKDISFDEASHNIKEINLLESVFKNAFEERKKVMAALQERERDLEVTLNSIGDAVIATDKSGNITRMNPVAMHLTGWKLDQAKGKSLKTIFPIVDASTRKSIENPIEKVINTGQTVFLSNHTTLISKTGIEYQIADSAAPIRDEQNQILGMVLVFNDVTEQYKLRQAAEKYKRDLQAIMDHSPAIIYVKGIDGCYTFVSQEFQQVFQLTPEQVIGKTDFDIFPENSAKQFKENDLVVARTKQTLKIEESLQFNGVTHTYISVKFPLVDSNGSVYAVCGISTDITDRLQTEEALRRSQKMEAIGQLTGGIAHDFNNQLGIIIGYLDFLEDYTKTNINAHKWVHTATRATQRCMDLTRQLLAFSRRQSPEKVVVDVNHLLNELQTMVSRSLTPEIEIQYYLADNLWLTEINPGEFQDALLNLLINARDAMPNGGKLVIETCNKHLDDHYAQLNPEVRAGDYIQLAISDTGMGMDKATQDRIFEPFFTTKPEGKGTGLGLAMVYGFVKRFGGYIKIYSESGVGTTARLYLPRSHSTVLSIQSDENSQTVLPKGHETILIVDDETDLLQLAEQYLTDLGYQTLTATNIEKAFSILADNPGIDLLFSDVVMPGEKNGYDLACFAAEHYPDLKVLLTSGYTSKIVDHNGIAQFSSSLLSKPYRKTDLANRIRQVLDGKTADNKQQTNNLQTANVLVIDDEEDIRELFTINLRKLGCKVAAANSAKNAISLFQQAAQKGQPFQVLILDLSLPGDIKGTEIAEKIRQLDPHVKIIIASGDSEAPEMCHYERFGFQGALEKNFNLENIKKALLQVL